MEQKQEAISFINTIDDLSEEERGGLIGEIERGEDIGVVFDKAEGMVQNKLETVFKEEGIELDENDPGYIAANNEMTEEMQAAENEFNDTMEKIDKEADKIAAETDAALVAAQKEDIEEKLKGL